MKYCLETLLTLALTISLAGCNYYPVGQASQGADGPAGTLSIEGSWATDLADPGTSGTSRGVIHQWLVSKSADAGLTNPVEVRVTRGELAEIENAPDTGRLAVGVDLPANALVSFAGLEPDPSRHSSQALNHGAVRFDGSGYVWTAAIKSAGATALRLHFTGFDLPTQAELFVYNQAGEVFGPYTGKGPLGTGEFWSHTVMGDLALVQLHHPGPSAELKATRFTIQSVGHLGPVFLFPSRKQTGDKSFCTENATCIEDASCFSHPAIDDAKNAIAHLVFLSGHLYYICTGGLLADTDASTEIPYLLTANHCFSKKREAGSLEAYFFYRTAQCGDLCDIDPYTEVPRTIGSTILSTNRTGDYTLVKLNESAPAGTYFLGWDASDLAYADGTDLYRVSHPKGSPQAYSHHRVDSTFGACQSWPMGGWIYSQDVEGATEGGSSGSPVLNAAGQVVGQLSGGCGFNVSEVCDFENNRTVDGALAAYFAEIRPYLDPDGPCTDADGDGYCESEDCDDNDPAVNPAASEMCGDSIDNDCDGSVDEGCGGDCLPDGDFCVDDSECCSGKCRGKPGSKICR